MTPERWQQVKKVVATALETSPGERARYVAQACGGDDELRAEVESLLAASEGTDSFPAARISIAVTAEHSILDAALGAQYEIVRELGRGGMGAVYLARERSLERFVAIKVLRPELAGAHEARERFRREARIAAKLSHPGILPLHTFGEVAGLWYFVMGYVRGVTLADRLRAEGRLPSAEVHRITAELADALDCAHRHGIIHRDIKPSNILLDEDSGRAILADFGVAKLQGNTEGLTGTGVVVGTPNFMSPEQALGVPDIDERSDIYSLGAVAYTMLTGHEPFADVRQGDLVHWRATHDPESLASAAPSVPKGLATVVMRSLARSRDARWADAGTLKGALERAGADGMLQLPASLRDLPTFGPYAVLWAVGWTLLAVRQFSSAGDRALLLLIALLVPVGFGLHLRNVGRHGLRGGELARVAFWPPEWWGMWWPRALRRPNDLWPRLPFMARAVRVVLSAFFVTLPFMILMRQRFADELALATGSGEPAWFVAVETMLVLGTTATIAGAIAWTFARELTWDESMRFLFGGTTPSPGWTEPHIARLLEPVSGIRAPDRDSAADHRRAMEELLDVLPTEHRALGTLALDHVRQLAAAISASDEELASLAHVASDEELDRLMVQRATFEERAGRATIEQRELTELVQRQLDVVRRIRDRAEAVARHRARMFVLLRGLWTRADALRDGAAARAAMRALLDEVSAVLAQEPLSH
ncbi:MAG: protein kinase [bacterium]